MGSASSAGAAFSHQQAGAKPPVGSGQFRKQLPALSAQASVLLSSGSFQESLFTAAQALN